MFEIIKNQQTPELPEMVNVTEFIKQNKKQLQDFLSFAKNHPNTAGLASNQVGLKDRYIAVKTTDGWVLAVNPKIVNFLGDVKSQVEGCLSWPGKNIIANRNERVHVKYYNIHGMLARRTVSDEFEAQVWQHEINHLNGVEEVVRDKPQTIKKEASVGRNDPCVCGSGVKYKRCCI
jgi:peptide deformylase